MTLEEQILLFLQSEINDINTQALEEIAKLTKEIKNINPNNFSKIQEMYLKSDLKADKIINRISGYGVKSKSKVDNILNIVASNDYSLAKKFYLFSGTDYLSFKENKNIQSIIKNVSYMLSQDFINLSKTTGFALLDNTGKRVYVPLKQAYRNVINESILLVQTGTTDYNTAIRNTLKQYANSGVRSIMYESGYSRRLDTAVRQNVLDGTKQMQQEIHLQMAKEFGANGVEISTHINSAPDHLPVQGRQFSNEEFNKMQSNVPFVDYKGNKYQAFKRQIGQWNCRHLAFPIILGVSTPNKTDEELKQIEKANNKTTTINGKKFTGYEATQEQRKMELQIRKAREKLKMFQETDDNIQINIIKRDISTMVSNYKSFSKRANLSVKMENTRV